MESEIQCSSGYYCLLGRWSSFLELCSKSLWGRYLSLPDGKDTDFMFNLKVQEMVYFAEQFSNQLAAGHVLGGEGSVYDSITNRFCELAKNYFCLKLYLDDLEREVVRTGVSPRGEHGEDESVDNMLFVVREFHEMCTGPLRSRRVNSGQLSLEFYPLPPPSRDWVRGDKQVASFRLLELAMDSLIETCVLRELDFSELATLGMGSDRLGQFSNLVASSQPHQPAVSENEGVRFWCELAASLLSNAVAMERALLHSNCVGNTSTSGLAAAAACSTRGPPASVLNLPGPL